MAWRQTGNKPLWWLSLLMHICVTRTQWVNSSKQSDICLHQQTIPSLVQIMSCRWFGDKPLSEPMLILLTGLLWTNFTGIWITIQPHLHKKFDLKMSSIMKWQPFCLILHALISQKTLHFLCSWVSFTMWCLFGIMDRYFLNSRQIKFLGISIPLTHWGRVTHICVSRLDHHWFR